jgi:hypothetical protein
LICFPDAALFSCVDGIGERVFLLPPLPAFFPFARPGFAGRLRDGFFAMNGLLLSLHHAPMAWRL